MANIYPHHLIDAKNQTLFIFSTILVWQWLLEKSTIIKSGGFHVFIKRPKLKHDRGGKTSSLETFQHIVSLGGVLVQRSLVAFSYRSNIKWTLIGPKEIKVHASWMTRPSSTACSHCVVKTLHCELSCSFKTNRMEYDVSFFIDGGVRKTWEMSAIKTKVKKHSREIQHATYRREIVIAEKVIVIAEKVQSPYNFCFFLLSCWQFFKIKG